MGADAVEPMDTIDTILERPLEEQSSVNSWWSVILMWVTLPFSLIPAIFGGACAFFFRAFSRQAMASLERGRPGWDAYIWWRYNLSLLFAFIFQGLSRLQLFKWERKAFGNGDHFWHGEGVWSCAYAEVDSVMKSEQSRVQAFGCLGGVTPDLFPSSLLIFLPNRGPDSEWGILRSKLHSFFLDLAGAAWQERVALLPVKLRGDVPKPSLQDLANTSLLQRSVVKCIFFVMLGEWLADEDASTLMGWRNLAAFFILPRLLQRFVFNLGVGKVKKLRKESFLVVEKLGLLEVFERLNAELPEKVRRKTAIELCDELMYGVGFAGIGGTCACVENTARFLQVLNAQENGKDQISFDRYSTPAKMREAYQADPVSYIKEVCRLAPPVTSVTAPFTEDTTITMAGKPITFKKGTLRQLALSLANRDPLVFLDPDVFEPKRTDLNHALTWNGAFGTQDDDQVYPRLCPGRFLALEVAQGVLGHILSAESSGVVENL